MWWGAIGSSFTVFIGGMLFILLYRGLRTAWDLLSGFTHGQKPKWARRKSLLQSHEISIVGKHKISNIVLEKRVQGLTPEEIARLNATETSNIRDVNLMHAVQEWAQRMISAQSLIGQGLFIAAQDKLQFWFELNSVVDFFTIPPVIVALYFRKDCIGLRFMRSLRLLQLPEILQYLRILKRKYVIVCGHITRNSIHDFLKDFTRKEREESLTDIVVMENFNPGLELQALFKRHTTQMKFFQGSVLSPSDLDRIRPDNADACLILADKNCLNPEAEDSANIMRAIAVKQYCPEIRVIAQVLQYHSKAYLQNIPSWDMKKRDSVICLSELKMGFIAQNCIVPGFSTLLANLFVKNTQVVHKTGNWLEIYKEGLSQEIYTEFLSDSFVGMPFNSVCDILINPDPSILIQEHTLGFFIAKKRTLVQRANIYCIECHQDIVDPRRIKKCGCKRTYDNEKLHYSVIRSQSLGVLPRQGASLEK
ncbi:hypothetical protein chiPu_0016875 [Chiloscyllium punctatum]|uniref:RCK N-terminal domain-containing protein n=1 Tax=Chiloscyllium punctatum TaxID=137246 RepID=A0A401T6R8_CHIPU|nr:hypothetical protein [Chiloscyllium punctatum]